MGTHTYIYTHVYMDISWALFVVFKRSFKGASEGSSCFTLELDMGTSIMEAGVAMPRSSSTPPFSKASMFLSVSVADMLQVLVLSVLKSLTLPGRGKHELLQVGVVDLAWGPAP
jgi:hypothetical protein